MGNGRRGNLLAALDAYTDGQHTEGEAQTHAGMIETCRRESATDEGVEAFSLTPANDTNTLETAGTAADGAQLWTNLAVTVVGARGPVAAMNGAVQGNAARLSTGFDVRGACANMADTMTAPTLAIPIPVVGSRTRETIAGAGAGRHAVHGRSIPEELAANATSAVLIIDMAAGLYERYGGRFVFEAQREVLAAARAANRPILEVIMYAAADGSPRPTHALLTSQIHDYVGLVPFMKPGTGSASAPNCVHAATVRDDTGRVTAIAPAVPALNLVGHLDAAGITDVIVMGFVANTCVGGSIFGTLRRLNGGPPVVNPDAPPANIHRWEYERGLLDHGFTVITARDLLGSDNDTLGTAYTT